MGMTDTDEMERERYRRSEPIDVRAYIAEMRRKLDPKASPDRKKSR